MRNMILIVDDHLDTCHPLAALLRMEGIETRCLNDPRAAVEEIERRRPDLLVLDADMPGVDGLELLRAIRAVPALVDLPTVFFTGTTEGEAEARTLGALDWVLKGATDWDELHRRIVGVYRERKPLPAQATKARRPRQPATRAVS